MDPILVAILQAIVDTGGSGLFVAIVVRFWPQIRQLLIAGREAVDRGREAVVAFASRGVVIMTRPVMLVVLPILAGGIALSTLFAFRAHVPGEGALEWFIVNLLIKAVAFAAAAVMTRAVYRVRMVDPTNPALVAVANGTAAEQQAVVNREFGRPWLFVPMMFVALGSLTVTAIAIGSDAALISDHVPFISSTFVAFIGSVVAGAGILLFVALVISARLLFNFGIDVGGDGWSGMLVGALSRIWPGLTGTNAMPLIGFTQEEQNELMATVRANTATALWFPIGVFGSFVIWFMTFHFVTAVMTEVVVTGFLLWCYAAWFGLRREMRPDIYNRIVWWVVFGGAVLWFARLLHSFVSISVEAPLTSAWETVSQAGCVATTMNSLVMIGVLGVGVVVMLLSYVKFYHSHVFKVTTVLGGLTALVMFGALVHLAAVPVSHRTRLEQCYGATPAEAAAHEAERERAREAEEARERSLSPGPMTAAVGPSVPTTYRRPR